MFRKFALTFFFCTAFFCFAASGAKAASLYFSPNSKQLDVGNIVSVKVLVDSQGQAINNAEAVVNFPSDLLQVVSVSQSNSIFSLWVQSPTFSNDSGSINFNGGLPTPGYNGSNGLIFSIVFRAKSAGTATVYLTSGSVLANDGLGTDVLSGQNNTSITITQQNNAASTPTVVQPPANIQNTGQIFITSTTYPDSIKWYNEPNGTFAWNLPAGTIASQTSLDRTQGTPPRVLRKPPISSIAIPNIQDGVWYFNARSQTSAGWSKIYSYKIQIDTAAPDSVIIANGVNNTVPILSAHDALSGIGYFMVQVDGADAVKITPTGSQTPLNIPDISSGAHTVKAIAYDLAGNSASATTDVTFPQSNSVAITNYSKTMREGDRITASGVGPQNSAVNIELVTQEGISRTYTASTTNSGSFTFQTEPIAGTGTYDMWAQAVLPNAVLGAASAHMQIQVNPSTVTKFSLAFKSLLTASNIIILILSILCLLGWLNYFLLRKSIKSGAQRKNSKNNLKNSG